MPEALKDRFGPEVPAWIADAIAAVDPDFDRAGFIAASLDGFDTLELTPRARHIGDALAAHLPTDREAALRTVTEAVVTSEPPTHGGSMSGFGYLPMVYFVADHGIDHFEAAMAAQYELTKRFTAEFSIRAFLIEDQAATLARLREWSGDPDMHVRRLVSEGTRPRLPWAPRLPAFQTDPTPVLDLLELLKDDPEEYVRRSVANNLNDISKDHPDLAVEVCRRWWADGDDTRRRLVRHGLRTLVKQGDPAALAVLGYDSDTPARLGPVVIEPATVAIGDKVKLQITVENPGDDTANVVVDVAVHFVKKGGSTRPKVFKGGEVSLAPGATGQVRKTVSLAQHSTRTHYPGRHRIEVLLNGTAHDAGGFDLR